MTNTGSCNVIYQTSGRVSEETGGTEDVGRMKGRVEPLLVTIYTSEVRKILYKCLDTYIILC